MYWVLALPTLGHGAAAVECPGNARAREPELQGQGRSCCHLQSGALEKLICAQRCIHSSVGN